MYWPSIPSGCWILVGDGRHAIIFVNQGDARDLRLAKLFERTRDIAPSHQLGSDRPGRSFSSATPRRSAYESGDPHLAAKREFIAEVAAEINAAADQAAFERLILVAPLGAVSAFRDRFSPKVQKAIIAELRKDLVKHTVLSISEHLQTASIAE